MVPSSHKVWLLGILINSVLSRVGCFVQVWCCVLFASGSCVSVESHDCTPFEYPMSHDADIFHIVWFVGWLPWLQLYTIDQQPRQLRARYTCLINCLSHCVCLKKLEKVLVVPVKYMLMWACFNRSVHRATPNYLAGGETHVMLSVIWDECYILVRHNEKANVIVACFSSLCIHVHLYVFILDLNVYTHFTFCRT